MEVVLVLVVLSCSPLEGKGFSAEGEFTISITTMSPQGHFILSHTADLSQHTNALIINNVVIYLRTIL